MNPAKDHQYFLKNIFWEKDGPKSNNDTDTDADSLINILPSYQMYQSTISRPLDSDYNENEHSSGAEPPTYLNSSSTPSILSPQESVMSGYFEDLLPVSSPTVSNQYLDPNTVYTRWEDSLLANTDKLRCLPKLGIKVTSKLKIEIKFTENVGKVGVKPKTIKPESIVLQQSHYLYGYVTVTNETDLNIPFDTFSVTFEGVINVGSDSREVAKPFSHKFLVMFDFNASWSDATLDRLKTDNHNPYYRMVNEVDPSDGTYLQLNQHKVFLPKAKYKKFFAFKLPEKLLDHGCSHGFVKHLQIPPSLGLSTEEIVSNLKRKLYNNEEGINVERKMPVTDFSFSDSNIAYSVCARIIGRAKDYKCLGFQSDSHDFVIVNSMENFVHIRPYNHPLFQLNRKMINEEAILTFAGKVDKIEEAIQTCKSLGSKMSSVELGTVHSANAEMNKLKHSYYQNFHAPTRRSMYEVFMAYKVKKSLFTSKLAGFLTLSTPKQDYQVEPKIHHNIHELTPSIKTQVIIPLKISFSFQDQGQLPKFDGISVELVCLTIKSRKLPIPVIVHPDMCYENNSKEGDDFDHLVIQRFQKYARELSEILHTVPKEDIGLDEETIKDIKCLANLKTHTVSLKIKDPVVLSHDQPTILNSIPWSDETFTASNQQQQKRFFKEFKVKIDIANTVMKKYQSTDFKLIPDFQSCFMGRYYAIQINLKNVNRETLSLKVPLVIQHPFDSQ